MYPVHVINDITGQLKQRFGKLSTFICVFILFAVLSILGQVEGKFSSNEGSHREMFRSSKLSANIYALSVCV